MDIKSLYTIIPHKDGLRALKHFLNKRTHQDPPTDTHIRLAELVLTTNAFTFNNEAYLQTFGVTMGSKLGPLYACLFDGCQDELITQTYDAMPPTLSSNALHRRCCWCYFTPYQPVRGLYQFC